MCGRFVTKTDASLEREFSLVRPAFEMDEIDTAPTMTVPIVYESKEGRVCDPMRWGLVPFWAKGVPGKYSTYNARAEKMKEAATYRGAWKYGKRCIFPTAGFYEWQEVEGQKRKQRWFIRQAKFQTTAIAGLWDRSRTEDGEPAIYSATIITMPANELLKEIHNSGRNRHRMPLFLEAHQFDVWLSKDNDAADELILPYAAARMEAWPVPSTVSVTNHLRRR